MSGITHTPPPVVARQRVIVGGLFVGGLTLTALLGSAAMLVPITCLGAAIYAGVARTWRPFGLTTQGTVKIWVWLAVVTFGGAVLASGDAVMREREARAQQIVALGRTDPRAQAAQLAAADPATLSSIGAIAPALEAAEQHRRQVIEANEAAAAEAQRAADDRRQEQANAGKITDLLARERKLDRDDLDGRMALYEQLTTLAPGRSEFADRLVDLTKKRDRREELRDHPERGLELVTYDWYRSGFDTIMMLNLTVRNDAPVPLKDMVVRCEHSAPSGTVIDSNTQTIYEVVRPHQTRRIRHINMGFMQSQATRSACEISEASVG